MLPQDQSLWVGEGRCSATVAVPSGNSLGYFTGNMNRDCRLVSQLTEGRRGGEGRGTGHDGP